MFMNEQSSPPLAASLDEPSPSIMCFHYVMMSSKVSVHYAKNKNTPPAHIYTKEKVFSNLNQVFIFILYIIIKYMYTHWNINIFNSTKCNNILC